ncbi:MAG: nicotinate-nucleotide adenylyltransferase [Pseudomonadales bacterium]|nr:nicotinate-nucleotide adenylyltransferase [Pseudomonadales bacterium]
MMSRIGVLGGMFDPIHNGHIEAASYARNCLSLDQIKLIPCSVPNHRAEASSAAEHRVAMLELAIRDHKYIEVDQLELCREGVSYSVETMRELAENYPDNEFVFILGLDAFNTLSEWHEWEQLFTLCSFFVLARSGATINSELAATINLDERRVDDPDSLNHEKPGSIYIAEDFNYQLSSTEVRSKLAEGSDLSKDLDVRVYSYINEHNLYH